jgi:dolichyl-phosphate-mannose-protein mannosyltransferase
MTADFESRTAETRATFLSGGMAIILGIVVAKFIFHFYFNNRYGYFRDEFDYMSCGDHLARGYVDQPPLIPFLVRITRAVFGDSLRSIRLVPALASAATVLLTAIMARPFGGRRFALILAAVSAVVAPMYLSNGSLLTTNCLEPILWMGCAYCAILASQKNDPRYWLWFGVIAGIGLQEKYSITVFGFGIVIGLLLTPERRFFANKWIWLGGVAAFLIFLPNFLWNMKYHWPFVELMRNIKASGRDVALSPFQYFAQQNLLMHPLNLPIWLTGLLALLFARRFRPYRVLGISYLVAFTVFVVLRGKNYYLAPIYPMLLAAGAVMFESGIERMKQGWLKPVTIIILLAGGAWLAPIVVPVLPVDQFISYMERLPFKIPRSERSHMRALLPQHYADQFGWEEVAALAGQAWGQLSPEERKDCAIFGQNYGQAGAIDFFGPRYGLPRAISGHQTYWLWGPRGYSGNCAIVLDDRKEVLEREFESVEYIGTTNNPYALEGHIPVFLVKRAKFGSLEEIWPGLKSWN